MANDLLVHSPGPYTPYVGHQLEMLEEILCRNTIIAPDTGHGKTHRRPEVEARDGEGAASVGMVLYPYRRPLDLVPHPRIGWDRLWAIRWDPPPNMASWTQSRRRAGRQRSTFTVRPEAGGKGQEDSTKWENLEKQTTAQYNDPGRDLALLEDISLAEEDLEDDELQFMVPSTSHVSGVARDMNTLKRLLLPGEKCLKMLINAAYAHARC